MIIQRGKFAACLLHGHPPAGLKNLSWTVTRAGGIQEAEETLPGFRGACEKVIGEQKGAVVLITGQRVAWRKKEKALTGARRNPFYLPSYRS